MFKMMGLRVPSLMLAICFLGCLAIPAPAKAENISRTLGGAAGLAAGSMAGAAISSAVIGAAGIASMPAIVPLLCSTAIVGASAWTGAKVFSKLGLALDEAAGPKAVWMMLGASLGAVAAIALIPAVGPFVGTAGLICKGLLGGVAGGVLLGLLHKQLDFIATPRNIYAAAGGAIGAVAGGIPGAVAGVAGGYALGSVLDEGFFAKEDIERMNKRARQDNRRFSDMRDDIEDWHHNRCERFAERRQLNSDYYDQVEDSFYWQNDYEDRDYYRAQERPRQGSGRYSCQSDSEELLQLQADWKEAMAEFEEGNIDPDTTPREREKLLRRVRQTQSKYERAVREAQGY